METELRETCRRLLADGTVRAVIGYGQTAQQGPVHPVFVTRPDEADQLVWNDRCTANLVKYLVRKESRALGKVAIVVKGCDARALVVLEKESQINRSEVVAVGMTCEGQGQPKCETCDAHVPQFTEVVIGGGDSSSLSFRERAGTRGTVQESAGNSPHRGPLPAGEGTGAGTAKAQAATNEAVPAAQRYAALEALRAKPQSERIQFWMDEFSRCVKCYACRQVCPLCYCERCIVDKNRPTSIDTSATLKGNFAWHIARAFHLAGRCVGCDQCTAACPAGIDLRLLNLALARAAEEHFGYRPGVDPQAEPIVGSYSVQDREDFIR